MAKVPSLGIHFGVTNSNMAVFRQGVIEVVPVEGGLSSMENYISFTDSDICLGCTAKTHEVSNAPNTVFSVKHMLGRSFEELSTMADQRQWPFKLVRNGDRPKVIVQNQGEAATFFPEELAAMLLMRLVAHAQEHLQIAPIGAVVAVPTRCTPQRREAIVKAASMAGISLLETVPEPKAAAIAYHLDKGAKKRNVLIFHFGGGTLDVSLLTSKENELEVSSSSGDSNLGGEVIDNILMYHFADEFERKFSKNLIPHPKAMQRLRSACVQAKHRLSCSKIANIEIDSLLDNIDFYTYIARARFEDLTEEVFNACMRHTDIVLNDAALTDSDITDVVLVGGSTRIPKLQQLIREKFSGKEMYISPNPELIVAYGSAVLASTMNGDWGVENDEYILDETALSLGIETYGGVMSVIVDRNTPIPTKQTKIFSTSLDYQIGVSIRIYEGERTIAKNNYSLGNISVKNIKPERHGIPKIEVTFEIDENGTLQITTRNMADSKSTKSIVAECKGRSMTKEDIGRVVKDANNLFRQDEARKLNSLAKSKLVAFCVDMMSVARDTNLMKSLPDRDSVDSVMSVCNEVLLWANGNVHADKQDFETSLEQMKLFCEPLLSLLSQDRGEPPVISMGLPAEISQLEDYQQANAHQEVSNSGDTDAKLHPEVSGKTVSIGNSDTPHQLEVGQSGDTDAIKGTGDTPC